MGNDKVKETFENMVPAFSPLYQDLSKSVGEMLKSRNIFIGSKEQVKILEEDVYPLSVLLSLEALVEKGFSTGLSGDVDVRADLWHTQNL